jgi:non-ribosomal peptide synthase protein (TIGR01720 family)
MLDVDALSRSATIIDVLDWRACRDGNRTAHTVVADGEREEVSLTFAELNRSARALAAELRSAAGRAERGDPLGGLVGDRVLVLCPVGLAYISAMVGCLSAGLVAVPAYAPDLTRQAGRLTGMIGDCGARIGVTVREMLPRLLEIPELSRVRWIVTGEVPFAFAEGRRSPLIGPDNLALLLYTSGSTAAPKGVMVSHRNLLHWADASLSHLEITEHDRNVVVTAPPHSSSLLPAMLFPIVAGIPAIHLSPESVSERPLRWLETISRTRATMSQAANFLFDHAVRDVPPEARDRLDLSCVRYLRNRGEAVRADTIARFEAHFTPCGLHPGTITSNYGTTEIAGIAYSFPGDRPTVLSVDRARLQEGDAIVTEDGRKLVGQGSAVPGHRIEIVDSRTLTRCDPGRVGEVWTSGPNVTQGYWNRPEETSAAFDAHLADTGEGPFFRTGDLGFLHGGELFITGRLKEIIVIRGRNLYPVDLEASLQGCHHALAGHAAAAFAIEIDGEERLAIVHECAEGLSDIMSSIRQQIAWRHGVQVHTVALVPPGAIPRIGPGKIGRAECRNQLLAGHLPLLMRDVLDPASVGQRRSYRPPGTPTEKLLAGIWGALLGVPVVGIDDAFADLGGDSLLSMQLLISVREAGLPITDEDVDRHRTIAALAAAIDARRNRPPQNSGPLVGSIRLTGNQLWLLESGPAWMVDTTVLTLKWSKDRVVDRAVLERAAQHLVYHHDALRLRCYASNGGWRAEYVAHTPPDLVSYCNLSHLPADERPAALSAELARLRASVDVRQGCVLRLGIIRKGEGDDLVALCFHHIAGDILSREIVIRDLDALCVQLARGTPPTLPPRTASIAEWVACATAFARSPAAGEEARYWSRILAHDPTTLRVDFPKRLREYGRERVVDCPLGWDATAALHGLRPLGLGLSDALHAALAHALGEEVGESWVLFRTMTHARSPLFADLDLSRTVGFLAREFPLLLEVSRADDPLERVRAIRAQMLRVPRHGMAYAILQDYAPRPLRVQLAGKGARAPIQLNYIGEIDRFYGGLRVFGWPTQDVGLVESAEAGDESPRHRRIAIMASVEERHLLLALTYHDAAYRTVTVERLAGRMLDFLTRLGHAVRT